MTVHPLQELSAEEFTRARDIIVKQYPSSQNLFFRSIFLSEPPKEDLIPYLQAEHSGGLPESKPKLPRRAAIEYDVVAPKLHEYTRAVVDLESGEIVSKAAAESSSKPYFTVAEFAVFEDACVASQLFKDAMSEFTLPEGFSVAIDPWPYGGPDEEDGVPRFMQGLVFGKNSASKNNDANHYAYPIPIIPIMDWVTKEIVRVDRLATGGADDGLEPEPRKDEPKKLFQKSSAAEYVPELLDRPLRTDLKPLSVVQPEGASFQVHPDGLVEWQKWRFRVSFTPREGAVLHDLCYDNRSILYRLSYSELTVPYGDPRAPFHRKQAFDHGDGGMGRAANNLELGCDCLGAIYYFNSHLAAPDGSPTPAKSVICLHEQDNGILWKHTNFRTNRAVVTRNRELVVQFIVTLANYEYIYAYKLDLAGMITLEVRATGVVSVVQIDEGKKSQYGNIVAPGVLAQNHQHVFAVRIDPAVDSYNVGDTQVVVEESVGHKIDAKTNPYGNFYEIQRNPVGKPRWIDAEPRLNRVLKLENSTKMNDISGKNVGYKLVVPATQMMLADEDSIMAKRAPFAKHNYWVTGYRDGELWAAGEFTNQSREESGGVDDMVKRGDWFMDAENGDAKNGHADVNDHEKGKKSSPVVWGVFGLTHNPRVEDWPVMPVEIHQIHLRPTDFFTSNPALDVPSSRNKSSVLVSCCGNGTTATSNGTDEAKATVQNDPLTHRQGTSTGIDAEKAGANMDGKQGESDKSQKRLSRSFLGMFKKN